MMGFGDDDDLAKLIDGEPSKKVVDVWRRNSTARRFWGFLKGGESWPRNFLSPRCNFPSPRCVQRGRY